MSVVSLFQNVLIIRLAYKTAIPLITEKPSVEFGEAVRGIAYEALAIPAGRIKD